LKRKSAWRNDFARLHKLDPFFFRTGEVEITRSEWSPSLMSLFYALHGDWMRKLGYDTEAVPNERDYKVLRHALALEKEVVHSTQTRLTAAKAAVERLKLKLRGQRQLSPK
jgi:hypothetical protein